MSTPATITTTGSKVLHVILNVISLIMAVTSGLMAMDATVHAIGVFSPQVALWWPVVLAFSASVSRIATIIKTALEDWADDGVINGSNAVKKTVILIAFFLPFAFACCATNTAKPATNARNAGLNAAGTAALNDAAKIIGNAAVATLFSVAQSEAKGGKVDFMQSGADALWSQASATAIAQDFGDILSAYSAGKAAKTAQIATKEGGAALAAGEDPQKVANALAAVISTAAGAPPAR